MYVISHARSLIKKMFFNKDYSAEMINKNSKGFTLMELLITVAIIGILAGIAVTAYIGTLKKAARSEAYSNLGSLKLLEEQYFTEVGDYSPDAADTAAIQVVLRAFQPALDTSFTYAINNIVGFGLPTPAPVPYDGSTAVLPNPSAPCFIAVATGIANTRVADDVFALDCNNISNY